MPGKRQKRRRPRGASGGLATWQHDRKAWHYGEERQASFCMAKIAISVNEENGSFLPPLSTCSRLTLVSLWQRFLARLKPRSCPCILLSIFDCRFEIPNYPCSGEGVYLERRKTGINFPHSREGGGDQSPYCFSVAQGMQPEEQTGIVL